MNNATYLFEGYSPDGTRPELPHSSESFWTSLFALFLLHLAGKEESDAYVPVWQLKLPPQPPCYYERRQASPTLNVKNVTFADIRVEPTNVKGSFFRQGLEVGIEIGGFRPDILIGLKSDSAAGSPRWVLIENKTVGADLNDYQIECHEKLSEHLLEHKVHAEVLLLVSVGMTPGLYRQAKNLQGRLGGRFGIILWEDILRQMHKHGFAPVGLDTTAWAAQFTNAIDLEIC